MKFAVATLLLISLSGQFGQAQTSPATTLASPDSPSPAPPVSAASPYTIFNASATQEAALRAQILQINPDVLPLRILFVSHWKYLDAARSFHLHVPTGFASVMFTHLPSRTVFVDNDRYLGDDWLAYWFAHELGHLAANSAKEDDAERAAREFRKRLKDPRRRTCIQATTDDVVRNKRCGS